MLTLLFYFLLIEKVLAKKCRFTLSPYNYLVIKKSSVSDLNILISSFPYISFLISPQSFLYLHNQFIVNASKKTNTFGVFYSLHTYNTRD
ncbi:hypothetical protein BDC45DRAFT_493935 [Circinella umbellata]|nr:hypothetical protein BDC45DRAFT_493935 [Circinella umbellata]